MCVWRWQCLVMRPVLSLSIRYWVRILSIERDTYTGQRAVPQSKLLSSKEVYQTEIMPSVCVLTKKKKKNKKAAMSPFDCSVFPLFLPISPHLHFFVLDAPTATAKATATSAKVTAAATNNKHDTSFKLRPIVHFTHSFSHLLFQHNTPQYNSTEPNATQLDSTQLGPSPSFTLLLSIYLSFFSSAPPSLFFFLFIYSQTTIRCSTNTCQPTNTINTTRPSHQFAHPSTHSRANWLPKPIQRIHFQPTIVDSKSTHTTPSRLSFFLFFVPVLLFPIALFTPFFTIASAFSFSCLGRVHRHPLFLLLGPLPCPRNITIRHFYLLSSFPFVHLSSSICQSLSLSLWLTWRHSKTLHLRMSRWRDTVLPNSSY